MHGTGHGPHPSPLILLLAWLLAACAAANAATLPTGFTETRIANGLASPTALAFAPDGRLFVAQQDGQLRVIKNSALCGSGSTTSSSSTTGPITHRPKTAPRST